MSRLLAGLPAGPPPGRRRGAAGKVSPVFRRVMRELFGDPLVAGALNIELPKNYGTMNKWAQLGYVERDGIRWRLTAKGKERAR